MLKTAEKIQVMLLKNQVKKEAGKRCDDVIIGTDDHFVYICIAGHRSHKIQKSFWFLNLETLQPGNKSIVNLHNETEKLNTTVARFTGYTKQIDGKTIMQIATEGGYTIWLSDKYVKEYGNINDLRFLVNPDSRFSTAIPQNENGCMLGIICPVNIRK